MRFDVPILFLVFNRPDTTKIVFDRIREIQPTKLFIAADGPRDNKGEEQKCLAVRKLILEKIDWSCDVRTLFRDHNLGCGHAVSDAITWFFQQVEEGIILEDDTLPDPTFFTFCKTLLEKYRNVEKIKMISGNNFQNGRWRGDGSYYFSAYNHIWGWATWRRAWSNYSYTLDNLNEAQVANLLAKYFSKKSTRDHWAEVFRNVKAGKIDTWDFQWTFSIWRDDGITILPNVNLVTNIGFGQEATHTTDQTSEFADVKLQSLQEIRHPASIQIDKDADEFTSRRMFNVKHSLIRALKKKIKDITNSFNISVFG